MRIVLILCLSLFFTNFAMAYTTDYEMGNDRYAISTKERDTSYTDIKDIKKEWYNRAKSLCPNGFVVENIEPDIQWVTVKGSFTTKTHLSGTIKCQ